MLDPNERAMVPSCFDTATRLGAQRPGSAVM